jgi:hypothetical protein
MMIITNNPLLRRRNLFEMGRLWENIEIVGMERKEKKKRFDIK